MNLPPSSGQHFRIGKSSKPFSTTISGSLLDTFFGGKDKNLFIVFLCLKISLIFGGLIASIKLSNSFPISSGFCPKAISILLSLAKVLIANGYFDPFTFSNKIAGLFSF